MNEITFVIFIFAILFIFGIGLPLFLIGSWVYQDAKQFEPINDWLTPSTWVLIVILSNYIGLIIYLLVRKSFSQKQAQCQLCGYFNQNQAIFCNQCGEPLAVPLSAIPKPKTSYKKLIIGGISFCLAMTLVIGSSIYYAISSENAHYTYSTGITWVSHKKGGPRQGYLSKDFTKMTGAKEVFYFKTKKKAPFLEYDLTTGEGEIEFVVSDMDKKQVFSKSSPAQGTLSQELKPNTNYQIIVKIDMAKDGRFAFDWR